MSYAFSQHKFFESNIFVRSKVLAILEKRNFVAHWVIFLPKFDRKSPNDHKLQRQPPRSEKTDNIRCLVSSSHRKQKKCLAIELNKNNKTTDISTE
jgi:hypothetical protein